MPTNSVLAKMAVQISANSAEFNKRLSETSNNLKGFTSSITKLAGTLGVAFSVQQVASFALEVSKLSGEAEAVRAAFDRLPGHIKLMDDLKEATGGTVSELELMKRAVQASNFDISLKALPKLLEFATLRAQQTGQSVDYLVDSIVTGIGRKSKLILDNLGISAVQLTEALGGVTTGVASIGDVADAVGKIADENLKKMPEFAENASTKLQRLAASWENLKVAIGDAANETGLMGTTLDALSGSFEILASNHLSKTEKLLALFGGGIAMSDAAIKHIIAHNKELAEEQKKQEQVTREVNRAFKEFNGDIDAYGKAIESHVLKVQLLAEFQKRIINGNTKEIETLDSLGEKLKEHQELFNATDINNTTELQQIGAKIIYYQKLIEKLEELKKVQSPTDTFQRVAGSPAPNDLSVGRKSGSDFLKDIGFDQLGAAQEAQFQGITELQEGYVGLSESIEMWAERAILAHQMVLDKEAENQASMQRTADIAATMGGMIGEAFGDAITGQKKFGDAMKQLIPQVLKMFLAEALGAIITAGAKQGAKSGNAIVGIAAAAAGVAAIGGLFSGINSGGGGSSSFRSSANNYRPTYEGSGQNSIQIYGTLKGSDIYLSNKKFQESKHYTSG